MVLRTLALLQLKGISGSVGICPERGGHVRSFQEWHCADARVRACAGGSAVMESETFNPKPQTTPSTSNSKRSTRRFCKDVSRIEGAVLPWFNINVRDPEAPKPYKPPACAIWVVLCTSRFIEELRNPNKALPAVPILILQLPARQL